MPNATVRVNARTLPEATTRRAALGAIITAGAVGATLALPAVAAASIAPSHPDAELFGAIERHRAAFAAFVDTCGPTDTVLAAQQGREVTQADEDAYDDAHAAEEGALSELKATAPLTLAGMRAAIQYFVGFDEGCVPEDSGEYMATLLRSPIFAGVAEARS
jgi:hypothetical protein